MKNNFKSFIEDTKGLKKELADLDKEKVRLFGLHHSAVERIKYARKEAKKLHEGTWKHEKVRALITELQHQIDELSAVIKTHENTMEWYRDAIAWNEKN